MFYFNAWAWLLLLYVAVVTGSLSLSILDGNNGFTMSPNVGSVGRFAGDINGDGFEDLVIIDSTKFYMVFGRFEFSSTVDLSQLNGQTGLIVETSKSLISVAKGGDLNGDGYDDVLFLYYTCFQQCYNRNSGTYYCCGTTGYSGYSNSVFVLYGQASFSSATDVTLVSFNIENTKGFSSGAITSAGDFNSDGFADFVVGIPGSVFVVYGSSTKLTGSFSVNGVNGFVIRQSGIGGTQSLGGGADVNGDGSDDIVLSSSSSSKAYVIYGFQSSSSKSTYVKTGTFDLKLLMNVSTGTGFTITGSSSNAIMAPVAMGGDINKDGYTDIIIAGNSRVYIVLGQYGGRNTTVFTDNLIGSSSTSAPKQNQSCDGFTLTGIDSNIVSVSILSDINGDLIEEISVGTADRTYVVYGRKSFINVVTQDILSLSVLDHQYGFTVILDSTSNNFLTDSGGDINGDGFEDFLITTNTKKPYVVYGTPIIVKYLSVDNISNSSGLILNGASAGDLTGSSLSGGGDFNGDGFDDVIIGAYRASPGRAAAGKTYIVFGGKSVVADVNLQSLDGSNGFVFEGAMAGDFSGFSVSCAGDINNDGFDDILIGAFQADPFFISDAGQSYVIFGRSSFPPSMSVGDLDGEKGFVINGVHKYDVENSYSGYSVAGVGDFNHDGFDDIVIGSPGAVYANSAIAAGEVFVVFGRSVFRSTIELADLSGSDGFVIRSGTTAGQRSGSQVAAAGDFNRDGYADFLIASADGQAAVLVYGARSWTTGSYAMSSVSYITINGGSKVASAGDFNGDGYDDIIVSTPLGNGLGLSGTGVSYVVLGSSSKSSVSVSSLDGSNGFVINGIDSNDYSGTSVAGAGDVNGDGYDDVLIGAPSADPYNVGAAGESYLLFGNEFLPEYINLFDRDNNVLVCTGIGGNSQNGGAVSTAGDMNGDGMADILIGSAFSDVKGSNNAGQAYVVYSGGGDDGGGDDDVVTRSSASNVNINCGLPIVAVFFVMIVGIYVFE